jgi:2-oxoglutarate ferredoxin oxidoreductase subunit alpha
MMEGISYIAASEVPVVIVDIMRGGPGLGNIAPSQGDYNQVVKGGGHGDYRPIVLAPASIQELIDLTVLAFDLAEEYRTVVFVIGDGSMGQMMEPAELPPMRSRAASNGHPDWALTGAQDRSPNVITSIYMDPAKEEQFNLKLKRKQERVESNEVRFAETRMEDADLALVAFGTAGRVAQSALRQARGAGLPVGLFRPISLYPFPAARLRQIADQVDQFLVVEMNGGQMLEDVRLSVEGAAPVAFYGRMGGMVPFPDEIFEQIENLYSAYRPGKFEETHERCQ